MLTYFDDGDGSGELTVRASFDGCSGVGAAYFADHPLLRFTEQRLSSPLPEGGRAEVFGGYWSETADVLEAEHVGLRVLPVGRTGQVTIRTHPRHRGARCLRKTPVDVLTSYEALRRLSSHLPAVVRRAR